MKFRGFAAAAVGGALTILVSLSAAQAGTYTTLTSVIVGGIGDETASGFDRLILQGGAGTFADAGQLGVFYGFLALQVGNGNNCIVCVPTSGSINAPLSVNGSPAQDFVIDWSWSATNGGVHSVALTLGTGTLDFGDYVVTLNLNPDILSTTGGFVQSRVTADIALTPLPAALPLFATGLGALGLLARRRKRKAIAWGQVS